MSRSGYSDDNEGVALWRGMVASATRGKRGQAFFVALLEALDAMPDKRLIKDELKAADGEVCAIGALGKARGVDMSNVDPCEPSEVAPLFNIAECLAQEVVYMNDEYGGSVEIPGPVKQYYGRLYRPENERERWQRMRDWAASQIRKPSAVSES